MQELLNINMQQNLQLVVQVAKEYTEQLGANKIIELLETHKSYHGLYYYLGSSIAFSEDPEVKLSRTRVEPTPSSCTSWRIQQSTRSMKMHFQTRLALIQIHQCMH